MSVNLIETDKAGLQKFYEEIIGKFETYAPVEQFGKYDYKKVSRLSEYFCLLAMHYAQCTKLCLFAKIF